MSSLDEWLFLEFEKTCYSPMDWPASNDMETLPLAEKTTA